MNHYDAITLRSKAARGLYVDPGELAEAHAFIAATRKKPSSDPAPVDDDHEHYATLEREHLGDPDKQTGIYHPDVVARCRGRGDPALTQPYVPSRAQQMAAQPLEREAYALTVLKDDYLRERMDARKPAVVVLQAVPIVAIDFYREAPTRDAAALSAATT